MPTVAQSELLKPKSWDEFEDIVWDLYKRVWGDPDTQRYGRTGQAQQGVDVYGRPALLGGRYAGIQCKRYEDERLTREVVEAEIAKAEGFFPPLAEYVIATTAQRDAKVQQALREINEAREKAGKFRVGVVFWEDLCSLLSEPANNDLLQKHYGDWLARLREAAGAVPPLLHQLRAPVATFTGRGRELEEIPAHLVGGGGGAALIAGLTGMGGVGKTELAYAVAGRLGEHYPDAQLVVDLKGTTDPLPPERAMAQVIHAFAPEARLPDDLEALRHHYRSSLAGRRVVLLLDDAAGADQLSPLLEVPPGVGVMVTSRRRLALRGLRRWDVDLLPPGQAVELLRKTAPSREDVDEAVWKRVAKLCGRLPLALRVAGALLETTPDLGGAAYADRLADEKQRLGALRLEDDPKRDVGAALGLSVVRLEAEHPEWAARWTELGLLPPASFDAALAAAVWGRAVEGEEELPRLVPLEEAETWETLHALVRRNLVDWDGKARRYTLHDLLRVYARDRAEKQFDVAKVEAVRLCHALHVLAEARRSTQLYLAGGENCVVGLTLLDDILPHLRAAFAWAREGAARGGMQAHMAMLLPDAAAHPLDLRLAPWEKVAWLEGAVAAARTLGNREGEGAHLGNLGLAYSALGEVGRAIEYHEAALAIAREIGSRGAEGNHLNNLGLAYRALGEMGRAIEYHEEALVIAREIGDRRGEGSRLGNLGVAYSALGEVRRAIEYHEQALQISREIGNRRGEGADLGSLGNAYANLGEVGRAIEQYETALAIAREIGDRRMEGNNLGNLGLAYWAVGEAGRAIRSFEAALAIAREIGDRGAEGANLGNMGLVHWALGEVGWAIKQYEAALAIAREIGDRRAVGNHLGNLGNAYRVLGEVRRAIEHSEAALAIARELGDRQNEGNWCWNLGLLYEEGDPARAAKLMQMCVDYEREIGHPDAEKDAERVAAVRARGDKGTG